MKGLYSLLYRVIQNSYKLMELGLFTIAGANLSSVHGIFTFISLRMKWEEKFFLNLAEKNFTHQHQGTQSATNQQFYWQPALGLGQKIEGPDLAKKTLVQLSQQFYMGLSWNLEFSPKLKYNLAQNFKIKLICWIFPPSETT